MLVLQLLACDKVDQPLERRTVRDSSATKVRKVLLEDYTGHTCGNCPAAAEVAENLGEQYGDHLVVIAVHAGFFAKTSAKYPTSYTTTVGNEWDGPSGFGVSGAGNPNGMVNRKVFDGSKIQKESKWPTSVSLATKDPYILGLTLDIDYSSTSRLLDVAVKANFDTSYTKSIKLCLVLTEDSIIGPQTDYRKNPDLLPDYVFMHMLRDAINGTWGTSLKEAPIKAGDSVSVVFADFPVSAKFNEKHTSVVAFAFDAVSREVLQVERVYLQKKTKKPE